MFEDIASTAPASPPAASGTTPRHRRRERTTREILDAAWELSRQHGLASLSMRDLAERVGLRAPSLYAYFPAKEAIYDAMFADAQRQLADHLADLPVDTVTRDDLRNGTRVYFEFCTADPTRYQLMFQRVLPGFEPSADSYALAVANLARMARQLAAAGIEDPHQVDLWTAVLTGLTSQQMANDPGGDRWLRLVDDTVDLLCDHAGIP